MKRLTVFILVLPCFFRDQQTYAFSPNSIKSRTSKSHNPPVPKPSIGLSSSHTTGIFGFLRRKTIAIDSYSFELVHQNGLARLHSTTLQSSSSSEETKLSSKAEEILTDIHSNGFRFRIVVIGNGAILETTSVLGPHLASNVSPKTGDRILTLASEDKSFEFHVKVDQVSKITFSEVEKPIPENDKGETTKTMRIIRLVNLEGGPMCSLILVESDEKAVDWFSQMVNKFGSTVEVGS